MQPRLSGSPSLPSFSLLTSLRPHMHSTTCVLQQSLFFRCASSVSQLLFSLLVQGRDPDLILALSALAPIPPQSYFEKEHRFIVSTEESILVLLDCDCETNKKISLLSIDISPSILLNSRAARAVDMPVDLMPIAFSHRIITSCIEEIKLRGKSSSMTSTYT